MKYWCRMTVLVAIVYSSSLVFFCNAYCQMIWDVEVVDSIGESGWSNSMTVDNDNSVNIVYSCRRYQNPIQMYYVKHAFRDSDSIWQKVVIDSGAVGNHWCPYYGLSLVTDQSNQHHLSYLKYDSLEDKTYLCYAKDNGGNWLMNAIDTLDGVTPAHPSIYHSSINVNSADLPGIAFSRWDMSDLVQYIKYLYFNGVTWDSSIVDQDSSCWDYGPSLHYDSGDQPHIAFYRRSPTGDALMYYYFDTLSASWIRVYSEAIVCDANLNDAPSLKLDSGDSPRFAYLNGGDLIYSWFNGSSWMNETITAVGFNSIETELELDALENPHIIYTIEFQFKVRHCYRDTVWHLTGSIDTTGYTIEDVSFKMAADNHLHVAYEMDATQKYAQSSFTGIEETLNQQTNMNKRLTVTPNPAKNQFTVTMHTLQRHKVTVKIYDIAGLLVKNLYDGTLKTGFYEFQVQAGDMCAGVYFICATIENHAEIQKLVIFH